MYIEKQLKDYLDDLAAKKPAPGGGSAAAMVSALGVGLISMVANFTIAKEKYKHVEEKMSGLLSKSENLRLALSGLIDEDIRVYRRLSGLYKTTRRKNSDTTQVALKEAVSVPVEICRLSTEAMGLCSLLAREGNVNLISDVGVAVHLLHSAFLSAKIFVGINLKAIKDEQFIVEMREILEPLEQEINVLKDKLTEEIRSILVKE